MNEMRKFLNKFIYKIQIIQKLTKLKNGKGYKSNKLNKSNKLSYGIKKTFIFYG